MRNHTKLTLGLAAALSLQAQTTAEVHDVVIATPAIPIGGARQTMQFMPIHDTMVAPIKGQPYSAEAVTESVRVLSDGTRITNKNTAILARDKEGRTRREHTLAAIGPWATAEQPPRMATITDPVTKEVFMLDLNAKTVRKSAAGEPVIMHDKATSPDGSKTFERRLEVAVKGEAGAGAPMGNVAFFRTDSKNAKTENLGRQNMEGVMVDGTRETRTIPAGEIGNDRPIISTTERWYSPELQIVIMTRTVDPQFGETTYRVSNLRRNEPNADLFRVPPDFQPAPNVIPSSRIQLRK